MDLPISLGETVANKYRVDHVIGAGGMGVVVAGYHLDLDKPIAIKFLNPDAGLLAEGAERFRREARAVARIHSEHVVRVLDVGLFDERVPYMVMELLNGEDLGEVIASKGPLPSETAADYVLQAIDAIAEAHAAGIVHRDLKPTNLFLARGADGTQKIKVLDFGISKWTGPGRSADVALTRTAALIGSPQYMSPEQMRSAKDVDARTDIWSLGAILYELLTAQPPYVADSIPSLCVAVLQEAPRSLRSVLPHAPEALQAVVSKCLAKELPDRFASVAELASALVPFCPKRREYAERAARLLPAPAARSSLAVSSADALSVTSVDANAPRGSTPVGQRADLPKAAVLEGTQHSWGETRRRMMAKGRGPLYLGISTAVVGAAIVAFWLARGPAARTSTSALGSGTASSEATAAGPAASSVATVSPAASPQRAPAASQERAPAAASVAQPAGRPSAVASGSAAARRLSRGAAAPAVRAPANASSNKPSKPAASGAAISDFGGRYY